MIEDKVLLVELCKLCIKCSTFIGNMSPYSVDNNGNNSRIFCHKCENIVQTIQDITTFKRSVSKLSFHLAVTMQLLDLHNLCMKDLEKKENQIELYGEIITTHKGVRKSMDLLEGFKMFCMTGYVQEIRTLCKELSHYRSGQEFIYPPKLIADRKKLKCGEHVVTWRRYLSLTMDNSKIMMASYYRSHPHNILCYDIKLETCIIIGETVIDEGAVTCIKCCDRDNVLVGTYNGFLIKFRKFGDIYKKQLLIGNCCPGNYKHIYGLCVNNKDSCIWCVTWNVCYKVSDNHNDWSVMLEENDDEWLCDVLVSGDYVFLLYEDKVRVFNIMSNKLELFSNVICTGGEQFQIQDHILVIISAKNVTNIVDIDSGNVLHKWELTDEEIFRGVDIDICNKLVYLLTSCNKSSSVMCIKC